MTRSQSEVDQVIEMARAGIGLAEIVRRTGLPRGTVRDWLAGRQPKRSGRTAPPAIDPNVLDGTYAYLLGLYLGDGYIASHPRGVYRLRIFLDSRYPGILDSAQQAMTIVCPSNPATRYQLEGCHQISSYSRKWPLFFPQHGPGRKHDRPIILTRWQRELAERYPKDLLRGLIHSDGCRFANTGAGGWEHPRYSFRNRSADIRGIFTWACDLLDLHWTTAPHTVYVSRKADVARMDEFIGPKS